MDPGPAGDHGSLVLLPVVVGSNPEPDLVAIQRLNMAALTAPGRRLAPKHATLIIVPVSQLRFIGKLRLIFLIMTHGYNLWKQIRHIKIGNVLQICNNVRVVQFNMHGRKPQIFAIIHIKILTIMSIMFSFVKLTVTGLPGDPMGHVQWLVVADHSPGAAPVLTPPLNMAELPVPVLPRPRKGVILTIVQVSCFKRR